MIHRSVLFVLAPLASSAGASQVLAQDTTPATSVSLTTSLRTDTNVAKADPARAAQRGLDRADQRLTMGAELSLFRPLGRNSLELTAFAGYDFYRRNTQLNRERLSLDGAVGFSLGSCLLKVSPSVERRQSDLSQLAVLNVPGIESVRNTQTVQDYEANIRCGRSNGLNVLAGAGYTQGNNSNPLRRISNYDSHHVDAGLAYTNPVLGDFTLTLGRNRVTYPDRAGLAGLSGYRIDELKATASRDIGAVLTADLTVTFSDLDPEGAGGGGFKGVTWSAGLTAVPTTRLRLTVNASRSLNPSLGAEALYSRDTTYSFTGEYALSPRTSLFVGAARNDRRFANASAIRTVLLTDDRLDQFNGGARFQVSRRLKMSLEGGHERRNANGTFFDYKNTYGLIAASLTLGNF